MKISSLNISDGHIVELQISSELVRVIIKDWKEITHTLVFKNVIGIEAYSPENIDLSHIKVIHQSDAIKKVCSLVEESELEISEYSFISVWNEFPILNIFSEDLEIL